MAIIDLTGMRITDRSDPHLSPLNRSGGVALNGQEQVVGTTAARWIWRATLLLRNAGEVRSWRTIKARLRGRVNYLRTSVCDRYRLTRREIGAYAQGAGDLPYGDGVPHSDDAGFPLAEPRTTLYAATSAGDTAIIVDAAALGNYMSNGLFFSIDDWLYQVVNWGPYGTTFNLTIMPPMKQDAAAGKTLKFDPTAVWVMSGDDDGDVDLRGGRFGQVNLNLVEAIGRAL